MVPHIHTKDGITVVLSGKPYAVARTDAHFDEVRDAVLAGEWPEVVLEIIERNTRKVIEATKLSPNLTYSGGTVLYDGEELHNYAVDKLIELLDANLPVMPLVNFLERLYKNPSKRVVDDLYRFLEHGNMPITDDGRFLAYKKVRGNYTDVYTGKFDNSIGAIQQMARNRVDENPDQTCSTGFHVCSYEYLPHFGVAAGNKVVVCAVDPSDVVAIPRDYNDTKMRVAKYEVVYEVTDYFAKGEDVLAEKPIVNREFEVFSGDGNGWDVEYEGKYFSQEEAVRQATLLWGDRDDGSVWVENASGDLIWEDGSYVAEFTDVSDAPRPCGG